jgi:hypothetical protein
MRKNGKYDSAQPTSPPNLSENDFWVDVPEVVKQNIQKAKEQLDRGEGIEHTEIMAKMKARFLNK